MCDLNPKTRANADYFVSVCICYICSDENFRNIVISRGLVCKVCLYKHIKGLQSRIGTFSHDMWCEVKLAGRGRFLSRLRSPRQWILLRHGAAGQTALALGRWLSASGAREGTALLFLHARGGARRLRRLPLRFLVSHCW